MSSCSTENTPLDPLVAVTLTAGDQAENHAGMAKIGTLSDRGFTEADLLQAAAHFPPERVELVRLHDALPARARGRAATSGGEAPARDRSRDALDAHEEDDRPPEAFVLILRAAVPNHAALLAEMLSLPWDTKAKMRGRVVHKHARHNLCFDHEPSEPDYEAGRGRVVGFRQCPVLQDFRASVLEPLFPDAADLKIEGNLYYDIRRCGIGFHGDSERRKTIGVRLGASFPLVFQWYRDGERVGDPVPIVLRAGDLYVMSEKANGFDWKKRRVYTLRHAAGCDKYTK